MAKSCLVALQEPAEDGASPAFSVNENPAFDQEGIKTSRPSTAGSREDTGSAKQGQSWSLVLGPSVSLYPLLVLSSCDVIHGVLKCVTIRFGTKG